MMRKLALALSVLLVPGVAAAQSRKGTPAKKPAAAGNPSPKVNVAGLRVVGPGVGPEDDRQRPFNWSEGLTVVVAVRVAPPFAMVELDKEHSTFQISDSQGTALADPDFGFSPDFTKDGTVAMVNLDAKGLPADGATHVAVKGSLTFKVSTGIKTVKATAVKLEKGTPVKVGTNTLTISEVEDGQEGPTVSFKATRSVIKGIKALRAKDGKGAPIEVNWSMGGGWDEEYQSGYRFKMAAKAPVTLEFDLFDGVRDMAVPLDVKAGVGIAAPAQ
jgi:hypothetical protein